MKIRRAVALALTASVGVPAAAVAKPPTHVHQQQYRHAYAAVAREFGKRAPGRNILRWGLPGGRSATDAQIVASLATLERFLSPAPSPVAETPVPASTGPQRAAYVAPVTPQASYSGGGYSIPSGIVQCESGGNYSAVNPSSGAGGAYQIMPSTWAAYGGQGLPQNASKSEQDRIAGEIYAKQGPSAWTCG